MIETYASQVMHVAFDEPEMTVPHLLQATGWSGILGNVLYFLRSGQRLNMSSR